VPDILAFDLLNKHLSVSRETFDRLKAYHDLLLKWQTRVNLISADTISEMWKRHFLDSLQLLKHIENTDKKIIDLGSGAGFPGMAIAIAGASNVHLIESDGKKIQFLKEVARITKTDVAIHHARIEDKATPAGDIIISRACSPLDKLLSHSLHYVSHETICLFHKGKNYSKELEEAKAHWNFQYIVLPSVTDTPDAVNQQGVILKLTNVSKQTGVSKREGL
jgi:16S rRNA (guanine527-N7)-methyltransferase